MALKKMFLNHCVKFVCLGITLFVFFIGFFICLLVSLFVEKKLTVLCKTTLQWFLPDITVDRSINSVFAELFFVSFCFSDLRSAEKDGLGRDVEKALSEWPHHSKDVTSVFCTGVMRGCALPGAGGDMHPMHPLSLGLHRSQPWRLHTVSSEAGWNTRGVPGGHQRSV